MKDYFSSGTFSSYNVDCPYKHKCTSANSFKCWSCKHNRGKRDYYEPDPPYRPYPVPWKPEPFKPVWVSNSSQSRQLKTPYFLD